MRRLVKAMVTATVLTLSIALPAQGAVDRTVKWVCTVPGEGDVVFVSAPDAALHGIDQANSTAGVVFGTQFGEVCRVEVDP